MPNSPLKNRILQTALALFNERGLFRVSTRDLAAALKISPGNLNYHFPNRQILLETIYEGMYQQMESTFALPPGEPLHHLARLVTAMPKFVEKYRFFFADLPRIAREYPHLAERHKTIVAQRLAQGKLLTQALVGAGNLKPEERNKNIVSELELELQHKESPRSPAIAIAAHSHSALIHQLWFTVTFWTQQLPILPPTSNPSLSEAVTALLWPHFTETSRQQWPQLIKKYAQPQH